MNPANPSTTNPRPRRVLFFPALVVGLLSMHIALCLWGVYLATSSQTFAVENDYYNKALHWDDNQAAERASLNLGWHAGIDISATADLQHERQVVLTLTDRNNAPLCGASVDLIYYHRARATDVSNATLRDLGEGHYAAALPLSRPGIWNIHLAITHGKDRFLAHQLCNVGAAH